MFGYLRLLLASLVVLSHLNITFWGLNPGVFAVVMFYILAGYVVSHLYSNILSNSKTKIIDFYIDRIKRIFPLYLYVISLTIFFLLISSFGEADFSIQKMINNLTIIPLNFYMIIDSTILTNPSWNLIPPAWSLGTELQAYLILPFALIYHRLKQTLAILSFIIYILANFSIIHPDYFGYRLIFGVLFIFLLGSSLQKIATDNQTQTNFDKLFILIIWFSILLFIPLSIYFGMDSPTYTKETSLGLVIGIPLIYIFSKSKVKLPFNHFFGALSYGIFLSHFLAIWIVKHLSSTPIEQPKYILIIMSISLLVAYIGVKYLEKK